MAKRKRILTEKKINEKLKKKHGSGKGKDYIPWLKVADVASRGVSLKTYSLNSQRIHHCLSRLESKYFYILEWSDDLTDIREQLNLDFEETQSIAKELGIKHPTDPRYKIPQPITTDFVLTLRDSSTLSARTVKYRNDLRSKRVLEKFEIEKVYWARRNVSWGIVTEDSIDENFVNNIIWVRKAKSLRFIDGLDINDVIRIEAMLRFEIYNNNTLQKDICSKVSSLLNFNHGLILYAIRFLIANKIWKVNMYIPINEYSILELEEVNLEKLFNMQEEFNA